MRPLKEHEGAAAYKSRALMNERGGRQPGDVTKGVEFIVDVLTGTGDARSGRMRMR